MRASLDKLLQSARGQSVLVAWALWLVGPGLFLVTLCVAALAAPQHATAPPCHLFWAHLIGAVATAAVCLFSEWRRAELWLTLGYYSVFWLVVLRLAAGRDRGGMEVAVVVLAAVVPAGFALVRVLVGVAKGRYGRDAGHDGP